MSVYVVVEYFAGIGEHDLGVGHGVPYGGVVRTNGIMILYLLPVKRTYVGK